MFERLIAYHILELLKKSLEEIIQRSERIRFADNFLSSNEGVILLDSICMKLSAVGESVKNLDKITKREFLSNYPEIPWKNVMGVRDVIVHHYFEVDAEEIFRICKEDVPPLLDTINRMLLDLHQ